MEKEKGWANCSAPIFLRQSEVLTVWRRLHIERDSMHNPDLGGVRRNTVIGTITNVVAVPAPPPAPQNVPIRCEVTVAQLRRGGAALSNLEDVDQYEHGKLTVAGTAYDTVTPQPKATPPIYANTLNMVAVNPQGGKCPPDKQPFDLHDDDQDNVLPRLPDLGWMQDSDNAQQNLFAMAYIRPIDDGGGNPANNQQNLAFRANVLDGQEIAQVNQGRNSTNTNDFWVSYIQTVFQGWIDADNDPNNIEDALLGLCRGCLTSTENGALIYLETLRDGTQATGLNQLDIERGTVVHEIGHQFKGRHPIRTEPDDDIMGVAWITNPANRRFNDRNLNQIRSICRPGIVAAAGGICPP